MSSHRHQNYVEHLVLIQLFRDGVHLSHQRQNIENLFLGDLAIWQTHINKPSATMSCCLQASTALSYVWVSHLKSNASIISTTPMKQTVNDCEWLLQLSEHHSPTDNEEAPVVTKPFACAISFCANSHVISSGRSRGALAFSGLIKMYRWLEPARHRRPTALLKPLKICGAIEKNAYIIIIITE